MDDLGDAALRWQRGWATARRLAEGEETGGAVRCRCAQSGRDVEYLAYDDTPGVLATLAERVLAEAEVTWLTVPTAAPGRTESALRAAGLDVIASAETLMAADLRDHPRYAVAEPYRLNVAGDDAAPRVTLSGPDGTVAAHGTVGLTGRDAVADKVRVDPAHRRRGLGSAVMSALADEAERRGADRGLLVASEEGRRLYTALGWRPLATVLIAAPPGTVYPA